MYGNSTCMLFNYVSIKNTDGGPRVKTLGAIRETLSYRQTDSQNSDVFNLPIQ